MLYVGCCTIGIEVLNALSGNVLPKQETNKDGRMTKWRLAGRIPVGTSLNWLRSAILRSFDNQHRELVRKPRTA
jgi:hypothetical protein